MQVIISLLICPFGQQEVPFYLAFYFSGDKKPHPAFIARNPLEPKLLKLVGKTHYNNNS